ncbi:M protein serotype 24-like isoform X2 [Biomphalaria glabrata]|nr:M protein; serotype 24-like isoform X2 [Biomphalaria glabrata]
MYFIICIKYRFRNSNLSSSKTIKSMMEQEGKPKKKKLQMEIMQLKRDVHKYHTLYEKQKEYCEEKLQELTILEAKHRELEHKCSIQEKEIEQLYHEHVNLVKAIEIKNQELEARKSELNSVTNSYQELSKILLLVDKHLQFLETEKLVDSGAMNVTVKEPNAIDKNNYKLGSKFTMEQNCNLQDKTLLSIDDFIAARETCQTLTSLTSLDIEKERLSRLLNHPQMGGSKNEILNVDNNNINKDAELFLKNSSVIWSTLEKTSANSVSTKDLIDKFKDKLNFCQLNLKKDKEINKVCKEELMKLIEKLQKELEVSQKNLEMMRSQDQAVQEHYQGLEKEIEKLQQELKTKSSDLETRNVALKTLAVENKKWRELKIKNEKQIRLMTEKLKVLEYVNKTRNEMFEQKLKQLLKTNCRTQAKVHSKQVQTDDTLERSINDASKYQMVLTIQDLLKKMIKKSEDVIKLESLLKKKSLIVENIVLDFVNKSNIDRKRNNCDEDQTKANYKTTLSSPSKHHQQDTESSSEDDSTLEDMSETSLEPEEMTKKVNSLIKFQFDPKNKLDKIQNYECQQQSNNSYNKCMETDRLHCGKRQDYRQYVGRDEKYNKLSQADLGSCTNLSFEMSMQKNMTRKNPCQMQNESYRKDSGKKLNTQSLSQVREELHCEPKKKNIKPNFSLLHESDSSTYAGNRNTRKSSKLVLQEVTTSSENDQSDTTEDFNESSELECDTSYIRLSTEMKNFLKQQNLELDRSQQNNSSNIFKNAEFYVILKGQRKKSS